MFTGIIEEVGTVKGFAINGSSGRIKIKAKKAVTSNQTNLLRKYFRYPFNAIPPALLINSHVPRITEHGCPN